MPGNQSHPKDIWSKNSTSPYEIFWPKLKGPSFKCWSEYNRCGLTKVILYSHPKTNSSHMSGVSCPQKETHFFQSQLFLSCYFGLLNCDPSFWVWVCHPFCIRQLPKVALGWCLGKRWRWNHSQRRLSWRHFLLLNWRVKAEAMLSA